MSISKISGSLNLFFSITSQWRPWGGHGNGNRVAALFLETLSFYRYCRVLLESALSCGILCPAGIDQCLLSDMQMLLLGAQQVRLGGNI